jgi:hypothetical protein
MSDAPYLALVVEHYRHPRNARSLAAPTHRHEGANPLCGDRLRIEVELRDGRLVDVGFIAITRSGLDVVQRGAGVPGPRRSCATLALRVLRQALAGPIA